MEQQQNRITLQQARMSRHNYFSQRGMQSRLVGTIIAMVVLAVIISITVTSVLYFELSNVAFKGDVPFYYIPDGTTQQAVKVPTAFDVLLPGLLICGLVMIILTLVIGVLVSHRIGGPITSLQRSMKEIGKGDLLITISVRHGDEFSGLAEDLTDMVGKIRQHIYKVQEEVVKLGAHPDLDRFHDLKEGLCKIAAELKYFKTE